MARVPDAEPRILGVDPGSIVTGWGLISGRSHQPTHLAAGIIKLRSAGSFPARLAKLQLELAEVLDAQQPTIAAVEAPFHGVSAKSALQLAHARGVILAVLAAREIEVLEYAPAAIKRSVTGQGRADKDQVRLMVGRLLGVDTNACSADESDALAVALCHLSNHALQQSVARVEQAVRRRPKRTLQT